jgi:hypothetical protein
MRDTTIRVEGGLPALPGTNITMPVLEHGPVTNGHALEAPKEFTPTNGQDPETKGEEPTP